MPLSFRGKARIREENLQGENYRRIGIDLRSDVSDQGHAAQFEVGADASAEPAATGDTEFREKAPVAQRDVGHDARRTKELRVRGTLCGREIGDDVLGGPTAASHDAAASADARELAVLLINDLE